MTPEQHRDLDARLAVHWLGWVEVPVDGMDPCWVSPEGTNHAEPPPISSDWNAMGQLLAAVRAKHFRVHIELADEFDSACEIWSEDGRSYLASADALPEAVALAVDQIPEATP